MSALLQDNSALVSDRVGDIGELIRIPLYVQASERTALSSRAHDGSLASVVRHALNLHKEGVLNPLPVGCRLPGCRKQLDVRVSSEQLAWLRSQPAARGKRRSDFIVRLVLALPVTRQPRRSRTRPPNLFTPDGRRQAVLTLISNQLEELLNRYADHSATEVLNLTKALFGIATVAENLAARLQDGDASK